MNFVIIKEKFKNDGIEYKEIEKDISIICEKNGDFFVFSGGYLKEPIIFDPSDYKNTDITFDNIFRMLKIFSFEKTIESMTHSIMGEGENQIELNSKQREVALLVRDSLKLQNHQSKESYLYTGWKYVNKIIHQHSEFIKIQKYQIEQIKYFFSYTYIALSYSDEINTLNRVFWNEIKNDFFLNNKL